jgi:phosphoglycerate dehydrogenase-like enzyme
VKPPPIAVGPEPKVQPWVREAVEAGGAMIVPVERAEALVWVDPFDVAALEATLEHGPHLRWVQLPWAGVEDYARAGVFSNEMVWTSGKGVYAEPVAEHALMLALALMRDIPTRVTATSWGEQSGKSLYDANVAILGGGGIATSLQQLLEPFRTTTTVIRRSGPKTLDDLDDTLREADVVVLALALTPETRHVIGAHQLALMQDHAVLVNVARGGHVVTDDLVAALRNNTIGGAGLDVTDPEPLPDGHPLWHQPNCIITPHSADTAEMIRPLLSRRITENVRRFASGDADLIGPVDPTLGY